MAKTRTYKSDAFAAIHKTASGMFYAGVIDKQTMRHFDESCLTPIHELKDGAFSKAALAAVENAPSSISNDL